MRPVANHPVEAGFILPGLPHPLLCPEDNPGWQKIRNAFNRVRAKIEEINPDLLLIYSTMWPSVIGHQIQSNPNPEWKHVDELFHNLGTIPYKFRVDADFANEYNKLSQKRGLHTRTVNYHGFPIDTGSVVVQKLVNPENKYKAVILSSNVYADRAETVVFAKAGVDALQEQNKKSVAIVVSSLSNRLHEKFIPANMDKIHSQKDEEWNRKMLELLGEGRLEDVAQLSRQIQREARVRKVTSFKPMWWLVSVMGAHNCYNGEVLEYQPIYGAGAGVIALTRAEHAARNLEFDEEDPEKFAGDRNVLSLSAESLGEMSSQSTVSHNPEDNEEDL